jgi:hypothetical protein
VESSLGFSFLCPYLGKHQPTLVETLTSTLLKLTDVFDKLPNVDKLFQSVIPLNILTTQTNKHTKMTILALLHVKKKCKSSGDGCVSTVKSHRGDNTDKMTILALKKKNVRVVGMGVCLPLRVTEMTIEAAAAGRGVTSVVQRLGS